MSIKIQAHRPVIRQDAGTGRYVWECPCGATWAEDPDTDGDPILAAEASARAHWRPDLYCRDCHGPILVDGSDAGHEHCGPLPHTGPAGGSYCDQCSPYRRLTAPVDDWRTGVVEHADPNHVHGKTALTPQEWRRLAHRKIWDEQTKTELWFVMRTTAPHQRRPIVSWPIRWDAAMCNFRNVVTQATEIRPDSYSPHSAERIVVMPVDQYVKSERDAGRA